MKKKSEMEVKLAEAPSSGAVGSGGAVELSPLEPAVREMASVMRRHHLDYHQTIYVAREARKRLGITQTAPKRKLPRNLTDAEQRAFLSAVKEGGIAWHLLLFEMLYYTGCRVGEMVRVRQSDVDVERCSIRINDGKGGKDRTVLFPEHLQLALRLHRERCPGYTYLFESRKRGKVAERYVQQLAEKYGSAAGIEKMTPHRLRHSVLTDLTRAGLSDAQIQLISGHSTKKSLEVYQALALSDVEEAYQDVMARRTAQRRRAG